MNNLYVRLAAQNIKKHRRSYVPFMLAGVFVAAVSYILNSLSNNTELGPTSQMMFTLGSTVVMLFAVIFLFYTNSFLMKQRKKELGLYNVLGMNKGHIARVIGLETLFTALIVIVGGCAVGILLDKLTFLIVAKMIRITPNYGFHIIPKSLQYVAVVFGVIYVLIYISNVFRVRISRPIELLHGTNVGEREPKTKAFMAILGVLCLGSGYALSILSSREPVLAISLFFVAVLLVIIGTYFLFTAGSIALLKLLRRNKNYYYKTSHFISVSGMLYRMKQNAVGLANICILSTMVLVILSSTCSLWFGAEDMIHTRYPADVLVSMEDPNHMVDMDTFLTDELKSVLGGSYTSYEFLTGYDSTEETEDHSSAIFMKDGTAQVDSITRNVLFFSAETYNRITGENVTVEPGTALYMSVDGVPMPDTMTFAGTTYTLLPTPKSFNLRGRYHAYVSKPYVVVLPDYAEKSQVITPTEYYCISLGKLRDEEQQTFYDAIREDVTTIMPDEESVFWEEDGYFNFECRVENTKEIRSMYGSFLFMGISLGFVFTMAAVLIIYYKQISEGMEDKNRFAIMRQVGLSQKEVKHAIHTQILTVFFLPLITAGIHVMFAYPIIRAILRAMMLSSETVFITCTVASFLVFSVLYAVVYALTAKVYYRIISEDNK